MKRSTLLTIVTCVGLILSLALTVRAAQQGANAGQNRSDLDAIRKVSDLLDADVFNRANEKVAAVDDVVLSPEGVPLFAVITHGGIVGVGGKAIALPWNMLAPRFANGKWAVNFDTTNEALEKAPKLESDGYLELTRPDFVTQMHTYFHKARGRSAQVDDAQPGPTALQTVLRASKIIGATLRNPRDENIGEMKDLLLDRNGRVACAVVGHGGVLGIGESYVPVPWAQLQWRYNRETTSVVALLDATKDRLERAPLIKGSTYETLLAPGFTEQVDRYFTASRQEKPRENATTPGVDRR